LRAAGAVLRLSNLQIDHHKKNQNNLETVVLDPAMRPNLHSWVEIDQVQVLKNIKIIKQVLGGAQLGVIIKGNAYGHGITPIIKILQAAPEVDWAISFCLSEAILARMSGFTRQLLVCGYADGDVQDAILHDIDLILHDSASLHRYLQAAKKIDKPLYVHIKVDTGLSRLGFTPEQAAQLILELQNSQYIIVRGLFSHFSESEAEDNWFAKQQLSCFDSLLSKLENLKIKIPIVHLANTVAIFRLPNTHKSLVRIGAGVYGLRKNIRADLMPAVYNDLKPVITWKSKIIQVRQIAAGSFISYGRTFQTDQAMYVAAVPVGYADGYDRGLSNNSVMYVNGVLAPVLGRVCMNLTMIDITNVQNTQVGDEVILLGDLDGIRVTDFMQRLDTIAIDVTTGINWTISRFLV